VGKITVAVAYGREAGTGKWVCPAREGWGLGAHRKMAPEVEREREYFQTHRAPLHYEAMAARGCPVGSGAMESFCAQLQGRLKRCGQFWSSDG